MEQNINALYPRSKGRGSTAIFDSDELKKTITGFCAEILWKTLN